MIRAKTLARVLQQSLTGGVQAALLFDGQGSLIAFAGEDINTNQMVAAVVANLWSQMENKDAGMEAMLLDFEAGRIVAAKASQFVLCLYGVEVPYGMLKSKAVALAEHLTGPMEQVLANSK